MYAGVDEEEEEGEEQDDDGEESISIDDVDDHGITYEEHDEGNQRQGNVAGLAQRPAWSWRCRC